MKNTVMLGDCLELMKDVPSGSIDMILCDLPYQETKNNWDIALPFHLLWDQYCRIIKLNGAIIIFGQGKFSAKLMISNEKMHRYNLIWQKTTPTGHLNAKKMPLRAHEDILVFYKNLPTYNPQKTSGHTRKVSTSLHKLNSRKTSNYGDHRLTSYDSTDRYPISILKFPTDKQKSSLHPTQKPVALFEYLIKTYTNEGETVLDNCAGSGTTAIACIKTNRNYILMEKEEKYYNVINERVALHNSK